MTHEHGVYMVIKHHPTFGHSELTYNKARAIREAKMLTKQTGGIYEVRGISVGYYNDCHKTADFPTFTMVSEQVWGESLADHQANAVWELQHGTS
jgi:hypothetical protein